MRRRRFLIGVCATIVSLCPGYGQGPTLAGSGYSDPSIILVAPGQITTIFVTGLKTVLPSSPVNANIIPLPTTLAGITVTLNQTPAPLLSIQQLAVCNTAPPVPPPPSPPSPDCLITAITVQIPYDLAAPGDNAGRPVLLTVSENGTVSQTFRVLPMTDNIHVMKTCDVFPSPKFIRAAQPIPTATGTLCVPFVTHGNGDLITANNPAQPGEEIVIWAFGMGLTNPTPKTGEASPTPAAPLASPVRFQFDFRVNAAPSRPYMNPLILIPVQAPVFNGLTPGQVGLYQVNLRIPNPVAAVPSCTTGTQTLLPYNTVYSNLTIDLGGSASFDGAAICVQPTQQ